MYLGKRLDYYFDDDCCWHTVFCVTLCPGDVSQARAVCLCVYEMRLCLLDMSADSGTATEAVTLVGWAE